MTDFAIRAEGLGKQYRVAAKQQKYSTLRDTLVSTAGVPLRAIKRLAGNRGARSEQSRFWALKDVTFDIARGEVVGVIGRNGAGKSTLLKVLSRITEPTEGYAEIRGRVGSLLEVGTGFHPELSGRENIYLNGAILGMRRTEIERKFDEIVEFAEVERFIDTPVKHYSSGMYLRLAFAVAAHLEPEILVVDEVLAVGDAAFQSKCLGRMSEVARAGRTVLFVSHSMSAIMSLCNRAIRLSQGTVSDFGPTADVVNRYISSAKMQQTDELATRQDRLGSRDIIFSGARFLLGDGQETDMLICGKDAVIELSYAASESLSTLGRISVSITISDMHGNNVACLWDHLPGNTLTLTERSGRLVCHVPRLPLMPGRYSLMLTMTVQGQLADKVSDAAEMIVSEGDFYVTGHLPPNNLSVMVMDHSWRTEA